jgi:hypothetical protein
MVKGHALYTVNVRANAPEEKGSEENMLKIFMIGGVANSRCPTCQDATSCIVHMHHKRQLEGGFNI